MRFSDFLKATVLLSAGCATLLATVTVLGITRADDRVVIYVTASWWLAATAIGAALGRRAETSPPIARLLAGARSQTSLPELQPGTTLVNRLWPLLLSTIGAAALAFVEPQVASVAAGFTIIWALAWRTQERAVLAIEERDGVRFYVDRTSPFSPIQLIRTPGFGGQFLPT
ncbi:MAG: hypothetical protein ACRDK0_11780 [Solirubrobacteraceae bacterium]